ncbi:hypothetical protein GCM10011579_082980 [Streptomyces albiflavescens]|uniref:Uncharacterized protein n=1 Tax=Streptomyces albiflavescens TaxID=1623582 RepID=A0A917YCE6_9ACTN|nr:hypothetical protein GCM10011579_082980 [Streptomyces albiflavescens]
MRHTSGAAPPAAAHSLTSAWRCVPEDGERLTAGADVQGHTRLVHQTHQAQLEAEAVRDAAEPGAGRCPGTPGIRGTGAKSRSAYSGGSSAVTHPTTRRRNRLDGREAVGRR